MKEGAGLSLRWGGGGAGAGKVAVGCVARPSGAPRAGGTALQDHDQPDKAAHFLALALGVVSVMMMADRVALQA